MILKIEPCKHCGRKGVLTERVGGWTVDCFYISLIDCVMENEHWCVEGYNADFPFFETPNEAVGFWNKDR